MKTWRIALKDTLIAFRDRTAVLLMIGAPLLIAMVMGMAFGGAADDTSPVSEIPVVIVDLDEGELADEFAAILADIVVGTGAGEAPLFAVQSMDDLETAKIEIERGSARGVVVFPAGFSAGLRAGDAEGSAAVIQVFTDPAATVSPAIVRGVVGRIATGFSIAVIGNQVAVDMLLAAATDIPIIFVNSDTGPLAGAVSEAFAPANFEGLFDLTVSDDLEAAGSLVEAGDAVALVHVTDGFSQAVMSGGSGEEVAAMVEITGSRDDLSFPIVEDVALAAAGSFAAGGAPVDVAAVSGVLAALGELDAILVEENASFGETEAARERIRVDVGSIGSGEGFNLLNYFVPSMAIFFLMFAVFDGTRSILEEEREGTLHRLMSTPTSTGEILLGKIAGSFLTGIVQFAVLVLISGLVFDVDWGKAPLGVALMVLATVSAATSLGALVASFARNVNQAGVLGSAITLVSAILGGNFIDFRAIPAWLTPVSKLTINRWALEGFFNLTFMGQTVQEVSTNILVLFGMAALFFGLAAILFRRRFVG